MIAKFLSGLNDFQKKLLVAALIIVIVALFDRILIGPTLSKSSSIDLEIAKEEKDIKQDMRYLGRKDRIIKEQEKTSPYLVKAIPTEEELIGGFLKSLEGIALDANITVAKVTPSTGTAEAEFLKYQADLECSGTLTDIVSFMHKINTSTQLLKVIKYTLSGKKADSDDIKASITVEKIIVSTSFDKPQPALAPGQEAAPSTASTSDSSK